MENIKIEKEVKFLSSVGEWAVSMRLPEYEWWGECCFDKDMKKAEANVLELVKKHLSFVREVKALPKEKSMIILSL